MCQTPGNGNDVHSLSKMHLRDSGKFPQPLPLQFHPIDGLELETYFVLLAMLENPTAEMDEEILRVRIPAIDREFISSILERLEVGGWTTTRWEVYDKATNAGSGRLFYRFTSAGAATAHALLSPLRERLFGCLAADYLNFKLDSIFRP
jgi:hypothetical protein